MNRNDKIKFSVCMSVYKNDNPEYFREAVCSIISQTIQPHEVIIVVDGFIPHTIEEVLLEFETSESSIFFLIIRLDKNYGLAIARHMGINNAQYELIAFMDSDDIAVENRFEKQLKYFQIDKTLSVLGGQISEFIDFIDNIVGIRKVPLSDKDIKLYMKQRCPFNHMTIMMRKSDVIKAGNYQEWFWNEDYYLWIRMMQAGCKFKNLDEILVNVRVGKEMYARRGGWKYFKSETKLQKYMYQQSIISFPRYVMNVLIRLIVQIVLPNSVRAFIFQKLFRELKK